MKLVYFFKFIIFVFIDLFTFRQLPWLIFFKRTDKWSRQQLRNFQLKMLNKNFGINTWGEFYNYSITTKDNLPSLSKYPPKGIVMHETSGSTGEPRRIWVPKETWPRKDAIFTLSWSKIGRKYNEWVFRLISGEPKYKWYDWWRNVYPSNYKTLGDKTVLEFLKVKPAVIHGPGGAIRQLVERLIELGHEDLLKNVHIEWCSESANGHRERIEPYVKSFNIQYGLAELPTVGTPDGEGNTKILKEQGIVEVVDDDGNHVYDEEGFIIVTDIRNTVTPIIRYKSGDRGKLKLYTNKDGNVYYILYDIIGRGVDYYNGPEVKKEIGWSIVAPISHILGDVISKWRIEVIPKRKKAILYVKWIDEIYKGDASKWQEYSEWIFDNYGLILEVADLEDEKYDIYFKNKLVKVTE